MIIAGRQGMMGGRKPYDTEVEYLESTGTQWIDTGVAPYENELTWSFKFASTGDNGGTSPLFGARETTTAYHSGSYNIFINESGTGIRLDMTGSGAWRSFTNPCTIQYSSGEIRVGSQTYPTRPRTQCKYTLLLCNINSAGTPYNATPLARIYSCQIHKGETLVRDFIPVRKGDVGYMYDKVSGKLFGNQGTGAFVLGADI